MTGRNGAGSTATPSSAAIVSAAASACCVARPPCLSGNVVASPAAKTSGTSGDAAVRVHGDEPVGAVRQAGNRRTDQPWQRDHAVRGDRRSVGEL